MKSALLLVPIAASAAVALAFGQLAPQPKYTPPDSIEFRNVDIYSEGTRMHGETFIAKANAGQKRACILMAHGWGGTTAAMRRDAAAFANAGYYVITFDYRGWASSDARVVLTKSAPPEQERKSGKFTAEVQEVRGVVDPIDMGSDWMNAIHWAAGDPQCDMQRFGLWGSSFSGGLVVYAAARDNRVKAIHSQVGSMDGRAGWDQAKVREEATHYARGQQSYPEPYKKVIGNLTGAPMMARFPQYFPVEEVNLAPKTAMQFVIAANEELFDNKDHAVRAYEAFKGVKRMVNIPNIKHYGIYFEAREQTIKLALEWYGMHLK
ncbi:MAG: acetylxylan esterase [Acidobacteria bacterium]|nr:acetylxylan esterase [Acidobacteriota bacterium]